MSKMARRSERNWKAYPAHPLQNNLVLSCVFEYLNLEEIKACRYVNKTWDFVAQPFLRKKGLILFDNQPVDEGLRNPVSFRRRAFVNSQTAIPFTAFKLKGYWTEIDLRSFLHYYKGSMTKLTLKNIELAHFVFRRIRTNFDMSCWIENRLTKLSVELRPFRAEVPSNIVFASSALTTIKDLNLKYCTLKIVPQGPKIKARKLCLFKIIYIKNGAKYMFPDVNEFVDFRCTEEVDLECVVLDMDMDDSVRFESIKLSSTLMKHLDKGGWTSKKTVFAHLPFPMTFSPQLRLEEFVIRHISYVDLAALPQTLEKLTMLSNIQVLNSRPVNLPELKFLKVNTLSPWLNAFSNCPNLYHLEFTSTDKWHLAKKRLSLSWLPQSLKVFITDGDFQIVANNSLNLDTLVMKNCQLDYSRLRTLVTKLKPKNICLDALRIPNNLSLHSGCMYLIRKPCIESFTLGKFDWPCRKKGLRFKETTILSKNVDRKSQYYFFKKGEQGTAISTETFSSIMTSFQKFL